MIDSESVATPVEQPAAPEQQSLSAPADAVSSDAAPEKKRTRRPRRKKTDPVVEPAAEAVENPVRPAAQDALTSHPMQTPAVVASALPVEAVPAAVPAVSESALPAVSDPEADAPSAAEGEAASATKRRRSRRSGRGRRRPADAADASAETPAGADDEQPASDETDAVSDVSAPEAEQPAVEGEEAPRKPRSRSRRRKPSRAEQAAEADMPEDEVFVFDEDDDEEPAEAAPEAEEGRAPRVPRKPRRRRSKKSAAAAALEEAEEEAAEDVEEEKAAKKGKKAASSVDRKMLVSVLPGDMVEVVLTENGVVREYYVEMTHQAKIRGNIYKGVINNIDTNLQAAFVNYGNVKNGFLQIDEVHPEYYLQPHEPAKGRKYPPIQKVLKTGQEVLVQVVKEPNGSKGAFLTTWLSLAGRFLVLTPGQEQIGVSRKVENDEERARLREMMNGIDPGQGLGVIVRTVSAGTTKTTLKNDLQYLKRLWRDIRKKATEISAPALIHQEPGLSERAVRDYLTDDVCEIWVDNEEVAQGIRDTVSLLFPRKKDLVRLHGDIRQSMWERFNLRRQLDQIYSREVLLPSGGRLVFDQTEALMAVDINSGKISGKGNFEAMAFKTNMEAAETIARQLKLRDVGGQVVIDFIEMRDKKHVLDVEKTLRQAMKNDRARHDVARMSSFGLLELVRQRMGSSALAITMEPCPACGGTGQRRNLEWQALQGLRELRRMLRATNGEKCTFETTRELGLYLLNHKRDSLREMEQDFGKCLEIAIRT